MNRVQGNPLFGRKWAVTVDTIKTTDLDIKYKVEKSTQDKPNTCELSVWNLTKDQRSQLEELLPPTKQVSKFDKAKIREAARKQATKGIPTKIEVGYGDDLEMIWLGDLRNVNSVQEHSDWVTKLESGDGEKAYQNARVNVSFGPKTPVDTALRAIARTMGVGEGNLEQVVAKLRAGGKLYPQGTVMSGPAREHMIDFCRSADLDWSIQDGALQFIDKGKALAGRSVRIAADTGMLGSPTVDVDGLMKVKTLHVTGLRPGGLIVLEAARMQGGYKIEKLTYEGDSSGDEWTIEIEAQMY